MNNLDTWLQFVAAKVLIIWSSRKLTAKLIRSKDAKNIKEIQSGWNTRCHSSNTPAAQRPTRRGTLTSFIAEELGDNKNQGSNGQTPVRSLA